MDIDIQAPEYDGSQTEVTVVGANVLQDVMLSKPDVFYFEDFGWNEIPAGWATDITNGFNLYGSGSEAGSIVFYKPNAGDDNSYLIMPPVNLNQTGLFSFRAGKSSSVPPSLKVGIATVEMKPGTEGSKEMAITGFAELYSARVTNYDTYSIFGFPLPATIGNQRLAFRFVGDAGT